jgi:hypothetical protein
MQNGRGAATVTGSNPNWDVSGVQLEE